MFINILHTVGRYNLFCTLFQRNCLSIIQQEVYRYRDVFQLFEIRLITTNANLFTVLLKLTLINLRATSMLHINWREGVPWLQSKSTRPSFLIPVHRWFVFSVCDGYPLAQGSQLTVSPSVYKYINGNLTYHVHCIFSWFALHSDWIKQCW